MRMRADQVREGQWLRGAVVTRVRPALDAGVVRISVDNAEAPRDPGIATGTFCYRADDVLDIEEAPLASDGDAGTLRGEDWGEPPARSYRVEYQAPAGDGYLIVRADASTTPSLVVRAYELLQTQGIDARIRRIVPVEQSTVPA
jgi:hypothetical protein